VLDVFITVLILVCVGGQVNLFAGGPRTPYQGPPAPSPVPLARQAKHSVGRSLGRTYPEEYPDASSLVRLRCQVLHVVCKCLS